MECPKENVELTRKHKNITQVHNISDSKFPRRNNTSVGFGLFCVMLT